MIITVSAREAESVKRILNILGPVGYRLDDFISRKVLEAKISKADDGSMIFEIGNERAEYLVRRFFEIGADIAPNIGRVKEAFSVIQYQLKAGSDLNAAIKWHVRNIRAKYSMPHVYSIAVRKQGAATEISLIDTNIDRWDTYELDSHSFGGFNPEEASSCDLIGKFHSLAEAEDRFNVIDAFARNYVSVHGTPHVADVVLAMYGD